MEPRDPQAKIRPLPPDAAGDRPPDPHRPWWVSAVFALAGLAAFGVVAAVLGTRAGDEARAPDPTVATTFDAALASPATTTTRPPVSTSTSTFPPTLSRIAPGLEYDLMIYATEIGGASVALNWNLSSPLPQESTLLARTAELSHSADGRRFAYLAASRVEGTLFIGSTPLSQEGIALRVTGFAWHGTEPDRLAWTARDDDSGATVLHAAVVDDTGDVVDIEAVATVDPGARLIAWGDWGYVVEWVPLDDPQFVMVDDAIVSLTISTFLDTDGSVRHRVPLDVLAASPTGRFVAEGTAIAFEQAAIDVTQWDVETRDLTDARLLYDVDLRVVDAFPPIRGDAFVLFSPDGERVVQVFATPNDTTIVNTISIDLLTYRAASLGTFATPVGFVDDQRIALNAAEGDLIILDWDKGTTWRLPLRPDLFVLDVVYR